MGKPPTFKVKDGPYSISPGPAAYTMRSPVDIVDNMNSFSKYPGEGGKSPQYNEYDLDYRRKSTQMKFATMSNDYFPSMTTNNFLFKESGPRFGSSDRTPLDVREKFNFPGPGTYKVKESIVFPKWVNTKFGSDQRKANFLDTKSRSPGPARYKYKTLIGKEHDLLGFKYHDKE